MQRLAATRDIWQKLARRNGSSFFSPAVHFSHQVAKGELLETENEKENSQKNTELSKALKRAPSIGMMLEQEKKTEKVSEKKEPPRLGSIEQSKKSPKDSEQKLMENLQYWASNHIIGEYGSAEWKRHDNNALVHNFTAPALARALRDREETLAYCAQLLRNSKVTDKRLDKLAETLHPFSELIPATFFTSKSDQDPSQRRKKRRYPKLSLPAAEFGGVFAPEVLQRLSTKLNRLPREVTKRSKKRACVIVPLCHVHGVPSILYTLRSEEMTHHKGEVCFPGGMADSTDKNIVDAGLREIEEETGISPDNVEVLGILRCDWSEVQAITGVAVTPIIGYLGDFEKLQLDLNATEVRRCFTVPIEDLANPDYWEMREFGTPVFRLESRPESEVIWGLTSFITERFLRLLPSVAFSELGQRQLSFDLGA